MEQGQATLGIDEIAAAQRAFFRAGHTKGRHFRVAMLDMLETAIRSRSDTIVAALKVDLGKSEAEAWSTELGPVLQELRHLRKKVPALMKRRRVGSGYLGLMGSSWVQSVPFGRVLVLAPWNYPFQLSMAPLITAVAAGNTVMLKPSEHAPATAAAMAAMIGEFFEPDFLSVHTGEADVAKQILEMDHDFVFYTGSTAVGRLVAESCGKRLIPSVLELGGKSPTILLDDADMGLAVRRVAWAKFVNAGQTCVAPDYVMVPRSKVGVFVEAWKREVAAFGPMESHIVNRRHFDRLLAYMDNGVIAAGGRTDPETLSIEPTLLTEVSHRARVMEEEIFGPILPVLPYDDLEELTEWLHSQPAPLAMYVFGAKIGRIRAWMEEFACGGGCINDAVLHVAAKDLPFGGVGPSGWGSYHGEAGFRALSHEQGVFLGRFVDFPLRYPPYDQGRTDIIKRLMS